MRRVWTLDELREFYNNAGCELLDDSFGGLGKKSSFICKCGRESKKTFTAFLSKPGCLYCIRSKFTQESVREIFEKANCRLLSDYTDSTTKMRYICSCGNESLTLIHPFVQGIRCKKCMHARTGETLLERYGFREIMHNPEFQQKYKNTIKEKYNVSNIFQAQEVKDKMKIANLKKYGVEHHIASKEVKEIIKANVMQNYGVENVSQVAKFRSNWKASNFKIKTMILPSGKEIKYQGFEDAIIIQMLEQGVAEDDLYTESELCEKDLMPEFWYTTEDGKQHRYFPDLFIKSQNRFIEVKSTYTFELDPERVFQKLDCVFFAGYNVSLYILGNKKEIVNAIYLNHEN